jgi:hypothetical protein
MNSIKNTLRIAVVMASVAVGTVAVVSPAEAHLGSWSKERSGCRYEGGVASLHNYAYTKKTRGSCSGHSWLRVQFTDGSYSGDLHGAGGAEVYGSVRHAWHKSQSSDGWGQSH